MLRPWMIGVITAVLVIACSAEADVNTSSMNTDEPWDLVWFSDSSGFGLAELWADRMEQELGVEVRVNDLSEGGLPAMKVLQSIDDEADPHREVIAEAEIIVIQGNPLRSGSTEDAGICVSTSQDPRDPPVDYSAADFEPYRDVLTSIWDIVLGLRAGQPTIVRSFDTGNSWLADHQAAGIADECTAAWEMYSLTIREAGAEYGIPTALMYDAWNGPGHDEDPREKGYTLPDGVHANDEGKATQVEVLHALGYDPVSR